MRMRTALPVLFSVFLFAQKTDEPFIEKFMLGSELKKKNVLDKYDSYDFSKLWLKTENSKVYGIIGDNHQRIRIKFLKAKKNQKSPNEYAVVGKSKVNETICDFKGTIQVVEIYEVKELHYGVDDEYANSGIISQGILIADYVFKESENQKHSGVFSGKLYSKWFLNARNQISYDDIECQSDGYFNNAFVGTWKSHSTGEIKICNWGDFRVPMANKDFDVGVGEFSVNDKYVKNGWENFKLAWGTFPVSKAVQKARKKENEQWWK